MWAGLVAIADASQGNLSSFDQAMAKLSSLVRGHLAGRQPRNQTVTA
jgi:hypothetical protein